MVKALDPSDVRVYTVNGTTAGSSSSLPDWLTRKRAAKGKRATREHYEGSIELIQGFEFPEASNRVKATRDGQNVIATGTYKPQLRVWDVGQLSLKFERHSDAENVDFVMLSDDWTKIVQLQNDRTVELHTQGGLHYKTRIPKFGRSLAYHFPSCDTLIGASGNEVYRLNLDQGRFMTPLTLQEDGSEILGVNVVDVNPAHQLLAFGVEGNGTVQFWDHRSRASVGTLRLPTSRLRPLSSANSGEALSVTAISSRHDGLSYAIGTSTGHTLLYDIRAANPFALKDQGYGLPMKDVIWLEGGSRMAGDALVLSADKKVVKIWDRSTPNENFVSITPANDLNNIHHVTDSGLLLTANEGIQMCTYFIPQLGPAPRWASFLENITEEMEDQSTRSVYEDYKFIDRNELKTLGLDNLVGTPALKPYMHGYFVSLKLYETARLIANPFAYADHRERTIKDKMEKLAETRIRKKAEPGVKVNKILAEKILRDEERARKREERKKKKATTSADPEAMQVDAEAAEADAGEGGEQHESILHDPRFSKVFEDPQFTIDVNSREYALLNPSSVGQNRSKAKTAVENEEEESDKSSSDGLGESDSDEGSNSDSDDEGELSKFDPRKRPGQKNEALSNSIQQSRQQRVPRVKYVPMQAQASGSRLEDKNATFGQRLAPNAGRSSFGGKQKASSRIEDDATEISWVPSASASRDEYDDNASAGKGKPEKKRPGVEKFGAGMEKGYVPEDAEDMSEADRSGRTKRRQGMRSGSRNAFRSIDG
ncbi:WD repeat-containing protein [Coprinopsis marcescibilis]|uniref:WD repeat-containing protein n=1 Tax=Coprinopsis marcescibilis TaxID=230819 RepID=A0A5C3KKQ8_COPMA|nr:WD repeat-containing protein [Coprinopsis marcescibilis]